MIDMKAVAKYSLYLLILSFVGPHAFPDQAVADDWKPMPGKLMTRWAKEVSPEKVLPEYPRPMMVRKEWINLNGLWDYERNEGDEESLDHGIGRHTFVEPPARKILVPFPIESALSGVGIPLQPDECLYYRQSFRIPQNWKGKRVLLHFGAVDWHVAVRVNGTFVGKHKGGYEPFYIDITECLGNSDTHSIVLSVFDPTDKGGQPRGKQVLKPQGIFYTGCSGIWQTVWLEPVPMGAWIKSLEITTDIPGKRVLVKPECSWMSRGVPPVEVEVFADGKSIGKAKGNPRSQIVVPIESPRLWSPDDPYLYTLKVRFEDHGAVDEVESYFGMREVRVGPDELGVNRILLNGKALFQFGPLDQGFWPDGIYTAPTDEALRHDVEVVKKMGGNMLRKHVKVEPQRFYYWCDKLGVLVWQDMPSGENFPSVRENFESELKRMIDALRNHPSIIMWVPFNEGWGQYDTERVTEWVKKYDPTRLVNNASGWTDKKVGDVIDVHAYPGPGMAPPEAKRASVLGEFGGLGLPIKGHLWVDKDNWGYVSYKDQKELTDAYVKLLERLPLLIGKGLSAAVYTQTTDCEIEVNGWLTYDREVFKIDPQRAAAAARRLYEPPPMIRVVVAHAGDDAATKEGKSAVWRYTTEKPDGDWFKAGFDDSKWKSGPAGFGTKGTPGAVIGTEWKSPEIWIRRKFTLGATPARPHWAIHHDEDAEVYLNGEPAGTFRGYTVDYAIEPLDERAAKLLNVGDYVIAIHCKQTAGGQYIDAGLVEVVDRATSMTKPAN